MSDTPRTAEQIAALVLESLQGWEARAAAAASELTAMRESLAAAEAATREAASAAARHETRLQQLQGEAESARLAAAREREQRRDLSQQLQQAHREAEQALARRVSELEREHAEQLAAALEDDAGRRQATTRLRAAEELNATLTRDNAALAVRLQAAEAGDRRARRRRELIRRLIVELRNRQRANLALKSGMDALRQSRLAAEQQHSQLLDEHQTIKARLSELQQEPPEPDQPEPADADGLASMEQRLQAQAELIEALQHDGQQLMRLKRRVDQREARLHQLEQEMQRKDALIDTLHADLEAARRSRSGQSGAHADAGDALASPDTPPTPRQHTGTVKLRALDASRFDETVQAASEEPASPASR